MHRSPQSLKLLGGNLLPAERENFRQLSLHLLAPPRVVAKIWIIRSELSFEECPDMIVWIQVGGV